MVVETKGRIKCVYTFELGTFRIIRTSDGKVLYEEKYPEMTIKEWIEKVDHYDKICNHK